MQKTLSLRIHAVDAATQTIRKVVKGIGGIVAVVRTVSRVIRSVVIGVINFRQTIGTFKDSFVSLKALFEERGLGGGIAELARRFLQLRVVTKSIGVLKKSLRSLPGLIKKIDISASRLFSRLLKSLFRSIFSFKSLFAALVTGFLARTAFRSLEQVSREVRLIGFAADRTGASFQSLSELAFIGGKVDLNLTDIVDVFGDLNERIAEFVDFGSGSAQDVIKKIGLQTTDAEGRIRKVDDLFFDIVGKLNAIEDLASREFLFKELFGDQAARILPFVNLGIDRLRELRIEARRLGVIFTPEQVAAATKFSDAVDNVRSSFKGLKVRVLEEIGRASCRERV